MRWVCSWFARDRPTTRRPKTSWKIYWQSSNLSFLPDTFPTFKFIPLPTKTLASKNWTRYRFLSRWSIWYNDISSLKKWTWGWEVAFGHVSGFPYFVLFLLLCVYFTDTVLNPKFVKVFSHDEGISFSLLLNFSFTFLLIHERCRSMLRSKIVHWLRSWRNWLNYFSITLECRENPWIFWLWL